MATAHLIYGYLGAGKTTFAKRLEKEINALRFSPDEWMFELYGNNPPAELFSEYHKRIDTIIERYWTNSLRLGLDVILDYGFWSRDSRDKTRAIITANGASHKLYFLDCPEHIQLERCQKRNHDLQGSLYIDDNTFEIFKARFEPLGDDEIAEVVKSDDECE
jgi:predicted kinase